MQLHTVDLPDGLSWPDEWDISGAIAAPMRRRLDGGLAVYPRAISAGRPITLEAPESQPITRAAAESLRTLATVPGATYTLTMPLRGLSFLVLFDIPNGPLDLRPLIDYADPEPTDYMIGTIRLMTAT